MLASVEQRDRHCPSVGLCKVSSCIYSSCPLHRSFFLLIRGLLMLQWRSRRGVGHGVETRSGHFIFVWRWPRYLMEEYNSLHVISLPWVVNLVITLSLFVYTSLVVGSVLASFSFCCPPFVCHSLTHAPFSSSVSFTRIEVHVGALPVVNNAHQPQRSNGMGFAR